MMYQLEFGEWNYRESLQFSAVQNRQ